MAAVLSRKRWVDIHRLEHNDPKTGHLPCTICSSDSSPILAIFLATCVRKEGCPQQLNPTINLSARCRLQYSCFADEFHNRCYGFIYNHGFFQTDQESTVSCVNSSAMSYWRSLEKWNQNFRLSIYSICDLASDSNPFLKVLDIKRRNPFYSLTIFIDHMAVMISTIYINQLWLVRRKNITWSEDILSTLF